MTAVTDLVTTPGPSVPEGWVRDFGITFGLAANGTKIVVADKVDITLDIQAFLDA